MLECFSTSDPLNLHRQPYALWNRLIAVNTFEVQGRKIFPTYLQLRNLLKLHQFDMGMGDFDVALDRGLMGGYLDWDIQDHVDCRPLHVSTTRCNFELWATGLHMEPWLKTWAEANDITTIHRRPYWIPIQMYRSLDRLNENIVKGPVTLLFLNSTDKGKKPKHLGVVHHRRLVNMIAVRRARAFINFKYRNNLWRPEGLSTLVYADHQRWISNEITRALRAERKFVASRLKYCQAALNGLPGHGMSAGKMAAVEPKRLHGVLRTLILGKYEALDKQVSLSGFTYERPPALPV